jgi:hypothetical protein
MTVAELLEKLKEAGGWLKARPHLMTWLLIGLLALFAWDRFRKPQVVTVTNTVMTTVEKKVEDTESKRQLVEAQQTVETLKLQLTETQKKVTELSKKTKVTRHEEIKPDGTKTIDTITETNTDSKSTTDTDKSKTEDKTKTDDKSKTDTTDTKKHVEDDKKTETDTKTTITPVDDARRWHGFVAMEAGPTLTLKDPTLTMTFVGGVTYRLFTIPLLKWDVNTGLVFTAPLKPKADPSVSAILGLGF